MIFESTNKKYLVLDLFVLKFLKFFFRFSKYHRFEEKKKITFISYSHHLSGLLSRNRISLHLSISNPDK